MMTDMKKQPLEELTIVETESTQRKAVEENFPLENSETQVQNHISNDTTTGTEITTASKAVMIKIPRADSKLILQNMEEVLKSVKKKHRAKHKRKRELKKLAMLEAAAADKATHNLGSMKKHQNKKPLQLAALENEAATSTHNSLLQSFTRTPKKKQSPSIYLDNDTHDGIIDLNVDVDILCTDDIDVAAIELKNKTNAFEVMMNARNKSIGTNSPGKEASISIEELTTQQINGSSAQQLKRKEFLQDWAERKGAGKRKLEEESRTAYVENQLENRAKRLKHMLVKTGRPKNKETSETIDDSLNKKPTKRRTRGQIATEEKDENSLIETSICKGNSVKNETDSSKRKTRKNSNIETNIPDATTPTTTMVVLVDDELAHRNSRPKRSCTTRKRYTLLDKEETEAVEVSKTRSDKTRLNTSEKGVHVVKESIEIVELDTSGNVETPSTSTPKRLAPLFTRGLSKPSPDPLVVEARRNFLQSGVPEKLLLEQARQKQYQQNCIDAFQLFPATSHIKQITKQQENFCQSKQVKSILKLIAEEPHIDLEKIKVHKFGLLTDCNLKEFSKLRSQKKINSNKIAQCRCNNPLTYIPGKSLVAKAWKLTHERFPTFKCYNQLREKYRYFSALDVQDVQQVSESLVVTRLTKYANPNNNINNDNSNDEFSQPPAAAPNGELLFTEKYKPLLFEQILVNFTPIIQLREFLSNFCKKRNPNSDSDMESDDASNSSAANMPQNGNTVVLLGPCASGKTNAVFALANEFNFNVLEINAGMKRTGKRLLQELHEATQSHQIRKKSGSKQNKLNGKRKSRKGANAALDSARRCLILIEDADIAFEQTDAGFVDAIYTLASVSKRPVIIVASNPNCAHLQRLIQQNTIHFALPQAVSISRYMSLLSLIENCPVNIDDIVSLYLYNSMDVRRTMLELQLFVQSGGDLNRHLVENLQIPRKQQQPIKQRYTVSPSKQHLTADLESAAQQQNATEGRRLMASIMDEPVTAEQAVKNLYIHKTLFDFYTVDQNAVQKIPYPVDFELLGNNVTELLQKSILFTKKLSPKKAWLSNSLNSSQDKKRSGKNKQQNTLWDFFEQLSAAAMINAQDQRRCLMNSEFSALAPRRLSADLTHTLVERAIEVNLCPESMPYNLFQTLTSSKNILSEYSNVTPLRGSRACALDWDPIMRNICRYEQQRANDERRSMRFYHYLRGTFGTVGTNFSTNYFDHVCSIFQDDFVDDKEQINQAA